MKVRLLLLLLCFCAIAKAQDSVITHEFTTYYYPSGAKASEGFLFNGKPDGWWKSFDEAGQLISEGNRKNCLLDSVWTFYLDGIKYRTIHYKEGKKEGEQILYAPQDYTITLWREDTIIGNVVTYDTAGWIKKSVPYAQGKPHGLAKEFNKNGLVIRITQYYHGIMSRNQSVNRTDKNGNKQGAWKYFWDNGNLKLEASYFNNKKHGFFKYYDEDGTFLYVEKYTNDVLEEEAKETKQLEKKTAYHTNGKPSIIATYFQNKPEGIRREFDTAGKVIKGYIFENGWLRYEGITDMNGLRQGLWKEYYQTGELRSKGKYKNSKTIGEWNFYFPDKTIEISGNYNAKGEKHGPWIWFYPSADTMSIANYDEGELDGLYLEYDEDQQPLVKGEYVLGYEEGTWYYRNGKSYETGKYEGGKKIGTWISYFEEGKVASKTHYDEDLRNGKYVAYWENGNIRIMGNFVHGLENGTWTQYNEEGTPFLTTLFKEGKELKWNNYTIK